MISSAVASSTVATMVSAAPVLPLHRPRIERELDGEGWFTILPNGHAWLTGSRRQALREFELLERIDRRGQA